MPTEDAKKKAAALVTLLDKYLDARTMLVHGEGFSINPSDQAFIDLIRSGLVLGLAAALSPDV